MRTVMLGLILLASGLLGGPALAQVITQPPCCVLPERGDDPFGPPMRTQDEPRVVTLDSVMVTEPDRLSGPPDRTASSGKQDRSPTSPVRRSPRPRPSVSESGTLEGASLQDGLAASVARVLRAHDLTWDLSQRPADEPVADTQDWFDQELEN